MPRSVKKRDLTKTEPWRPWTGPTTTTTKDNTAKDNAVPSVEDAWAERGAVEVADVLGGVPDQRRLEVAWHVVDDGEHRHASDTWRLVAADINLRSFILDHSKGRRLV